MSERTYQQIESETNPVIKQSHCKSMGLSYHSILQVYKCGLVNRELVFMKARGKKLYLYNQKAVDNVNDKVNAESIKNLYDNRVKGFLSDASVKRIVTRFELWSEAINKFNQSEFCRTKKERREMVMITVTFPLPIFRGDLYIKRNFLTPFLQKILYHNPYANYLWKMEKTKSHQPHFHIITDTYIPMAEAKKWWYDTVSLSGAVDEWEKQNNKKWTTGLRIEALRDKTNAAGYVAKYMSKKGNDLPCDGRLWGCNKAIKDLQETKRKIRRDYVKKMMDDNNDRIERVYYTDNYIVIDFDSQAHNYYKWIVNAHEVEAIINHNINILNQIPLYPYAKIEQSDWAQEEKQHIQDCKSYLILSCGMPDSIREKFPMFCDYQQLNDIASSFGG